MNMRKKYSSGFSLIEMMIVLIVLSLIMAAVFAQIMNAQARINVEQAKLDLFQEAREFMDQMTRDLHNAGYPNARNYGWSSSTGQEIGSPMAQDARDAVGLMKVDKGDLWFEGDVVGDGRVYQVKYHLEPTGLNCPCLQRSWKLKQAGDPLSTAAQGLPDYQVEVQNVLNGSANYTLTDHPIFYAYYDNDTQNPIALPIDSNNQFLGRVDTIKVILTVQAKVKDPVTRLAPTVTLMSTVKLNNCNSNNTGDSGNMGCGVSAVIPPAPAS
jgi:prepilin-type N-terminal cleavage/methylation domain-containing protein